MLKYIINKNGPILFPENIAYETFAMVMGEIISSGYCVIWFSNESKRFECFTLPEITATPEDYKIIEKFFNG